MNKGMEPTNQPKDYPTNSKREDLISQAEAIMSQYALTEDMKRYMKESRDYIAKMEY